jgi:hypothetical protein
VRLALAASSMTLALLGRAPAKPSSTRSSPLSHNGAPRTAPALPMLPSVARVRVEVGRDRVVLLEEVNLPRGDWRYGGLDVYAAFGAPGPPLAVDAQLLVLAPGAAESRPDDIGEPAIVERAPRCGLGVQPLLGPVQMAGLVVHLREAQLRRAFTSSERAVLRLRSLLRSPAPDNHTVQDLVVRLGVAGGLPMTIERIQIVSLEDSRRIAGATAKLCGPDADPWPLSVSILPRPPSPLPTPNGDRTAPIAPEMAVRHATDDLCISWIGPQ